jgi:transcriptional regulator with XRE-family HTH domain
MRRHARDKRTPNRLWKYRKRMGFSQRQVAAIMGYLSPADISRCEHGRKVPSLVTALKFEIVYRVPVAFLFPELYHRLKDQLRAREERLRAE